MARFGLGRLGLVTPPLDRWFQGLVCTNVDRQAAQFLDGADLFMALSGCGLGTGLRAQANGAIYVCDRSSSHILYQKRVLDEEADRRGVPRVAFSNIIIERELAEYAAADAITVPSEFVRASFIEEGFSPAKLHKIPLAASLEAFHGTSGPPKDSFEVLFVGQLSLRKGLPYLFEAFSKVKHPAKRLTIAGLPTADFPHLKHLVPPGVRFLGHVPHAQLKSIMAKSHVLALPSIEEGLALVMGEAMACGCPVVASENSGARDLFSDGVEGFIVPPRDSAAMADRIQAIADDAALRERMSQAARLRIETLGGWGQYGSSMIALFERLLSPRATPANMPTPHVALERES
ncbi:MAG: glycosyltransferase family 4 protein [Terricaulis sp.]